VMTSLGFATLENVMYVVFSNSDTPYIWIYRAALSVPAHMLFAVTMGYYFSLAKFAPDARTRRSYMLKSLIVPVILHGTYDLIVMSNMSLLLLALIPFMIYLWVSNLKKLNHYYKESKRESLLTPVPSDLGE
ncbi:MAG: PrsW family intramembrane metalloprotease, partial [Vallitaleaceae bacterium]|nr:PrsW family intramembrane metalloprotease [Vallitaleaceae bacterium]